MKDFILSILTVPGLLILLYFFGLVSQGYKKKLKIFSSCLFMMFVISLPFFGKIFSYPLLGLPKFFISSDLNDVKSAVVLTGGIYKNIINKWQPSKNTEERIKQMKNQAIKDIKNTSVNIAIQSVEALLKNSLDKNKLNKVFENSIQETKTALKTKSS